MIPATQMKPGMTVLYNNEPHRVVSVHHVTSGRGMGMVQAKLKNLKTGSNVENRFRSDERVERARLETHEMEYLYSSDGDYHFMNTSTFEQITLTDDIVGDYKFYLIPNIKFMIEFYNNSPVGVEPPKVVELEVVDTAPFLKGATATSSPKPATLETGLVVNVPPFVENGEVIRVDTENGKYIERAR
ncbi:MAG: elongation factor P [Thermodesulfobacteriota bacterium]|nr:MAG: elongation factor P [Thermodesulfobacteriota bacterium]